VTDADLALQQLMQVEKLAAIGELGPGIAHELNTPLGVIISNLSVLAGYGESLARLHGGPPAADLDYILEDLPALTTESIASANRIAEIVRSVVLFARDAPREVSVNVEDALQAALTLTWHELKQRANIERDFASVPPVIGSASELTLVFIHVLRSAAQGLPARGGVVSVKTMYAEGAVTIRIAANGATMGVGVSICQEIITRHQGTIDIESGPNAGTTVTIRLAAAAPAR
jgi:two-component system NtrC family sensor kinase